MSKGTRNISMAALLALVLGTGELVAFQGIARHTDMSLWSERGSAALEAGRIVARSLGDLAVGQAREAAGALLLHVATQTSQVYRLASGTSRAGGETGNGAAVPPCAMRAGGENGNGAAVILSASRAGGETGNGAAVTLGAVRAGGETGNGAKATLSACRAGGETGNGAAIEAPGAGSKSDCPACPLCPARSARGKV